MRLKSIYISDYKNLKDFNLTFDGNSFIDIFVGKNGAGKSNLFEALIEIFRHLYEYDKDKTQLGFDYTIAYEINEREIKIDYSSTHFTINGKKRKTIGNTLLPDNILIYYSGHNDVVAGLIERYESTFCKRIKTADFAESRHFIGVGSSYKELLLAVLLMQVDSNKAREFICKKLDIALDAVSSEVNLVLKRPVFADRKFQIDSIDRQTRYWGTQGIACEFLDKLVSCIKGEFSIGNLYNSHSDTYTIPIDIKLFQKQFNSQSITDIFRQFDNLKTLGMLSKISMPLRLNSGITATIDHFSDGQFQSVYIYSIIELFKDRNCITLLDEPDSFLHPEWQFEFLKQVVEIADTASGKNHVLMSSHSAATLCSLEEQNINLFKIDNSKISCTKRTKKEAIHELSNSFIQYSEDESKLLIDNVIRSSNRPILFVEGSSDVSILNTAYKKLYPNKDIPILIQDAFDRGFIRTLISRDDIFKTYNNKQFFALFDFDEAYQDWRGLCGRCEVDDIELGLCKKLTDKNAYAFLLPIPNNDLRRQVWDENDRLEKVISKPCFTIEHIFWKVPGFERYFCEDERTKNINFKGNKVKFAKDIVPSVNTEYFEVFRPTFEFIESKIKIEQSCN